MGYQSIEPGKEGDWIDLQDPASFLLPQRPWIVRQRQDSVQIARTEVSKSPPFSLIDNNELSAVVEDWKTEAEERDQVEI